MKSRKLLLGCGIVLALGLGIVLIGVIAGYLFPKQASSGASSILVNINLPLNGAELPLNEPVSIYAEAVSGSTVHDLELWLDGAFSPTKMSNSPVDQPTISAVWLWTPAEEGVHRLIVRAIGPDGEVVNSNVVRVSVLPRDQIADLQVTPIPPDQLPPVETPAADAAFQIPEGPTEMPPAPPFPEEGQAPAVSPVGAPSLQGSINQCDAALLIQDNAEDEKGFYIYRIDPTSAGFTRVATLDKYPDTGNFTYIDPGLSLGNHTYYIASFDKKGESVSNMINLKVTDPQCAASSPQAFGLQDAVLTTTKAVDKVYCYLSVNQGPWSRLPPGGNQFIYPTAGGFDLSKYLNTLISPPPPGGVTLELECWGWSGGTLMNLGYLKKDIGTGPIQIIGVDFALAAQGIEFTEIEGAPTQPPVPNIAPPLKLKITGDYNECVSILSENYVPSTAATECKNSLAYGYTYLSWKWSPYCSIPSPTCHYGVEDIDGYRVYKIIPGGKPEQVFLTANGKEHRWAFLAPVSSGGSLNIVQYFVRAYKGNQESKDSVWLSGPPPQFTKTFPVHKVLTTYVYKEDDDPTTIEYYPNTSTNEAEVGYDYHFSEGAAGAEWWVRQVMDTHIAFDVNSQTFEDSAEVTRATLRWKLNHFQASGGGAAAGVPAVCWVKLTDGYYATIADYPLIGEIGFDVTTQVRYWVKGVGIKRTGFNLLSGSHSMDKAKDESCILHLSDFELEVSTTLPAK